MIDLNKLIEQITPGAAGIWVGVLMFIIYFIREYRETHRLSLDDRIARRDGYAAQVASLTTENRSLRTDISAIQADFEEYRKLCREETDGIRTQNREETEGLRRQIRTLVDEITGIRRAILSGYLVAAENSPVDLSQFASDAGRRSAEYLQNITEKDDIK